MKTQMYMNPENKPELYTSPEVEVYEIKARQVICLSNNDLGDWGYNDNDL